VTGNEYYCRRDAQGRLYDHAIIALIQDPDANKTVLVVWGLSRYGSQAACYVLQHYDEYSDLLKGNAVIIKWTDVNKNMRVDGEDTIELVEHWP